MMTLYHGSYVEVRSISSFPVEPGGEACAIMF